MTLVGTGDICFGVCEITYDVFVVKVLHINIREADGALPVATEADGALPVATEADGALPVATEADGALTVATEADGGEVGLLIRETVTPLDVGEVLSGVARPSGVGSSITASEEIGVGRQPASMLPLVMKLRFLMTCQF